MTMNNTPFNWKNKTEFVPATNTPEEKKMSTYDYLNNAETNLRDALKSSTDLSQAQQLRRIVDTISTVNEIKSQYSMSVSEDKKVKDGFFPTQDLYDNINFVSSFPSATSSATSSANFSANSGDQLILG